MAEQNLSSLPEWQQNFHSASKLKAENEPELALLYYSLAWEEQKQPDLGRELLETLLHIGAVEDASEVLESYRLHYPGAIAELLSGRVALAQDDPQRAQQAFEKAQQLDPQQAEARLELARVYTQLEAYALAFQAYRHYQSLKPQDYDISLELADLLDRFGDPLEAAKIYQHVYIQQPHRTEVLLKCVYHQALQSPAQVVQWLIDLAHEHPQMRTILAIHAASVLRVAGEIEEARQALKIAIEDPLLEDREAYVWLKEMLLLPLMLNNEEIRRHEQRLNQFFAKLNLPDQALIRTDYTNLDPYARIWPLFSLYAYLNLETRSWREDFGKLFQSVLPPRPPLEIHSYERPQLVFVLNSNAPIQTFFQRILSHWPADQRAKISICYSPNPNPRYKTASLLAASRPDFEHIHLSDSFSENLEQIASLKPQLLFLTEVHTDRSLQSVLACHRLAPVQVTSWLSSGTTGLSTIDYFLSSELLEQQDNPQRFYSEQLVLLKSLPTVMNPPLYLQAIPARHEYGLPEDANLYICPQLLYKLHPDLDVCFAEILDQDPQAILVLLARPNFQAVQNKLLARLEMRMPEFMSRIYLMPTMEIQDLWGLMQIADVMLDPFYFGGGATSAEAFGLGVPIVTWPGQRLHGRITYAYYRQMGIMDAVALNPEDYVKKALRLGMQPSWRQELSTKIKDNQHKLFNDQAAQIEIANCLIELANTHK